MNNRAFCRFSIAFFLGVALLLLTPGRMPAADCQFVLGFKTLRDLIGHDIVGECLDNEHYNAIGDSNQHTTGGLLAWRKADNWTAFTDGYRTWVNGPNGLQQRLNTERFEWEADYAEITGQAESNSLTQEDLRNAELQTGLFQRLFEFSDARVRLQDGIYEDVFRYGSNGSVSEHRRITRIREEHPFALGDLDRDGNDDAVAIVGIWEGGNIVFSYLTAFRNDGGVPVHVASVLLGAKIGIDSITISDGIVTVQTRQLGPDDANCCPSQDVLLRYRLAGTSWLLLDESIQSQTQSTAPEVITWPWNRDLSPEDMLGLHLRNRGMRAGSTTYRFLARALRVYAYSAYPVYLIYLDSLGVAVKDVGNTEEWEDFVHAYLSNPGIRREVHSAVGSYMRTTEYLGPILTTFLKGEVYGPLQDKVDFLSLVGTAIRDSSFVYVDGRSWQGECGPGCQKVRGGLVELHVDYDISALERLPNPWKE